VVAGVSVVHRSRLQEGYEPPADWWPLRPAVAVVRPRPDGGWNVEALDERVAEIRWPYLDTLAHWPAVA